MGTQRLGPRERYAKVVGAEEIPGACGLIEEVGQGARVLWVQAHLLGSGFDQALIYWLTMYHCFYCRAAWAPAYVSGLCDLDAQGARAHVCKIKSIVLGRFEHKW